jgi:hypothetical protein
MDYKYKYLKYKKKYLELKGEHISIEYDSSILENPMLSKLKESIYSYCYLLSTSLRNEESEICPKHYTKISCVLIDNIEFGVSGGIPCKIKILKDNVYNNIVLCFAHGTIFFCNSYDIELINNLKMLYEKLQKILETTEHNQIIITGHSMGSAVARLFTYMIMVIESSTEDDIKIPDKYCSMLKEDISIPIFKGDEKSRFYEIRKKTHEEEWCETTKWKLINIPEERNTVKCAFKEIISKKYPKIHDKIYICIGASFPVLFRKDDYDEFKKYINFYNNRHIHIVKVEGDYYDEYTLNYYYKKGYITGLELSNFEVYNIFNLQTVINLNNLPSVYKQIEESSFFGDALEFHKYVNYIPILKKYITVNDSV